MKYPSVKPLRENSDSRNLYSSFVAFLFSETSVFQTFVTFATYSGAFILPSIFSEVTESSESSFMCLHKDKSLRLNGYRYAFFSLRLPAPYSESAKVYGSLQGWAQSPLLPLLLPITELIRHIPEWHTQSAPCTNISVSTPSETTFFMDCMSISLASTTLSKPASIRYFAPSVLWHAHWVLA